MLKKIIFIMLVLCSVTFAHNKLKFDVEDDKGNIKISVKKEMIEYVVKKGDTLSKIAKEYNTTVTKLVTDNNIENIDFIFIDQKLIIW